MSFMTGPFLWTSVYYVLYWLGDHDCIMVFLLHKIQLMYSLLLTWASFIKEMSHKTLTLLTGCPMSNWIFFSRFYSILTKYNWCILCCWHGHLLSKKWATRPLHYLQGVPCQIGSFFLDFILSWQNTIDVFFVTDMGIFYQKNEPHDPYITYSVSNIQLYLPSSVNETTVESRVLTRITNSEINFLSKGHSTYGSKIPFISNLKKPACASKWDVLEFATLR